MNPDDRIHQDGQASEKQLHQPVKGLLATLPKTSEELMKSLALRALRDLRAAVVGEIVDTGFLAPGALTRTGHDSLLRFAQMNSSNTPRTRPELQPWSRH